MGPRLNAPDCARQQQPGKRYSEEHSAGGFGNEDGADRADMSMKFCGPSCPQLQNIGAGRHAKSGEGLLSHVAVLDSGSPET